MNRLFRGFLLATLAFLPMRAPAADQESKPAGKNPAQVVIIPVRSPIDKPALYILRRGLKEATAQEADTVVIDMDTPGGRLDITLEIMEAIDRFPGKTVTYVNDEAISAGAIIASVTDEIHFTPKGTIGAAEAIMGSGQDISDGLKRKLNSYMGAKIRAYAGDQPLRSDVIRAMMEPDFELKVGDKVLKKGGELLSLTASEAMTRYGDPPNPLLGSGISKNLDELLDRIHGAGNYQVNRLEPSWSENVAQWLNLITKLLLSVGLLGLFIEFKTPGFGVFGITGILLLCVVFFGHHVAGLSGYEPMLVMLVGVLLILIELFFFPGTVVLALSGVLMILGSLVWMMLDIWPNQPVSISGDTLTGPLLNLLLGVGGAVFLFVAILRFLPHGGPWGNLVLTSAVAGEPTGIHPLHSSTTEASADNASFVGKTGIAATDLYPSGQVDIEGKRYEAHLAIGAADAGTPVVVTGTSEFGLNVEVRS